MKGPSDQTPVMPVSWTVPVWHRSLAQAIDHQSITTQQISAPHLMEQAAAAVARTVRNYIAKTSRDYRICVVCGSGNNGGDGRIAGNILREAGFAVTIVDILADWRPNFDDETKPIICIDAILGLGFQPPLKDGNLAREMKAFVARLAELRKKNLLTTIAIDLPSGLSADAQPIANEPHVHADLTVTFGSLKPVHVLATTRHLCGSIEVADIGFPQAAIASASAANPIRLSAAIDDKLLQISPWQHLAPTANKYDRGHVLVVGGSKGKTGAPFLAGLAALRAGAGWVTLALPPEARDFPDFATPPELTYEDLWNPSQQNEAVTASAKVSATALAQFLQNRRVKALVIGPGCMEQPLSSASAQVVAQFINGGGKVVVDAGALPYFKDLVFSHLIKPTNQRLLLTPHPGEWQRAIMPDEPIDWPTICGVLVKMQESGLVDAATTIYKGAVPLIFGPRPYAIACTGGDLSLARAGTGDVLAGVAAAHMLAGLNADHAFARAYAVIAAAARLAASQFGRHSVLATDIIATLGKVGPC